MIEPVNASTEPGPRAVGTPPERVESASEEDPIIALFKQDVDRSLLVENLRRTYDERARRMAAFLRERAALRSAFLSRSR